MLTPGFNLGFFYVNGCRKVLENNCSSNPADLINLLIKPTNSSLSDTSAKLNSATPAKLY